MEQQYFTWNRICGIVLAVFGLFLMVSLLTHSPADAPDSLVFPKPEICYNWCGSLGARSSSLLFNLFGYSAYLLFLPMVAGVYLFWHKQTPDQIQLRAVGFFMILLGSSGLAVLLFPDSSPGPLIGPGGYFGIMVFTSLISLFATTGCVIFCVSLIAAGSVLSFDYSVIRVVLWAFGIQPMGDFVVHFFRKQQISSQQKVPARAVPQQTSGKRIRQPFASVSHEENGDVSAMDEDDFSDETDIEEDLVFEEKPEFEIVRPMKIRQPVAVSTSKTTGSEKTSAIAKNPKETATDHENVEEHQGYENYELPSTEFLIESPPYNYDELEKTVQKQAKLLEKAFADFGFNIKVVDIQTGPVISQFEVQLERGLRLSKITGLTDDLAIALKVPTVRIVAPIPGKNTVGVEVPNTNRQLVRLREVIEETFDRTKSMAVPIFLGKDVVGSPMIIDLAKMPHLLIAGRTGTGKSVCLNTIIVSILMTRRPDECRMIMIDPKMVELSSYQTIPHLMHPVVTDMKKAEAILCWAVDKMEQRYQILARAGVRQLSEFNKLSEQELLRRVKPQSDEEWDAFPRSLPYLVIVADEMADLMMTAAKEVESHIIRLAQKSRAVGIHLVLATQKPTVDILTGLIKSNLPARIAFEVASRTDSQVVLDRTGAEKLLGNGDLLFLQPGTSQVLRGQGTYVSDDEINDIIEAIGTDHPDYITELVELKTDEESSGDGVTDGRDELYADAVEYIIRDGRGSVSFLQRKFKIGYGRAARLIDYMAEDGIVGPSNGSQAREVTMTLGEWRKMLAGNQEKKEKLQTQDDDSPFVKTIKPKLVPVKPVSLPPIPVATQEDDWDSEDEEYDVTEDENPEILEMPMPVAAAEEERELEDDEEYEYEYEYVYEDEEEPEEIHAEDEEYDEDFTDEYEDEYLPEEEDDEEMTDDLPSFPRHDARKPHFPSEKKQKFGPQRPRR